MKMTPSWVGYLAIREEVMASTWLCMEHVPTSKMLVWTTALCGVVAAAALLLIFRQLLKGTTSYRRLPPGPRGWPVVGNIFDLGSMPHASLANLKNVYGPLIWLRLGSINTLVVSSVEAAAEMFKNHDQSFCNRHMMEAFRADEITSSTIAVADYGPHWRMLRRLTVNEIFSRKRIEDTRILRRKCVDKLIKWISDHEANNKEKGNCNGSIVVSKFVSATTFNMISNVVFSKDLIVDLESKNDLYEVSYEILKITARPNVADLFPSLRWLDPQGIKKKIKERLSLALEMAGSFVEERRRRLPMDVKQQQYSKEKDFLDALLEFQSNTKDEPINLPDRNLNMFIMELFMTGMDSTVTTIEWAMAELLHNPEAMRKVKAEITQVVGHEKKIEESDIEDLHYLNAVIKETLRLHPTAPFLVPRTVVKDTEFMGYLIPKDTQVFVNAWGLGRDPSTWDDPSSFKPERFLSSNSTTDYRGQNFEFLPFGAGRRICPGLPLAHQFLHLVLGSLVQSFEWVLEDGVTPETMDMRESLGTALKKTIPLKAIPKSPIKWES